MSMTVTLAYPPSTNRLVRMANGIAYTPKPVRDWTKDAVARLRAAGANLLTGSVQVAVELHPKATKVGKPYRRRVDLDNALKAALGGIAGLNARPVPRGRRELMGLPRCLKLPNTAVTTTNAGCALPASGGASARADTAKWP